MGFWLLFVCVGVFVWFFVLVSGGVGGLFCLFCVCVCVEVLGGIFLSFNSIIRCVNVSCWQGIIFQLIALECHVRNVHSHCKSL